MSTDPTARRRRARGSLSAEEILDAAAGIVEHEGLQQLSMPHLARTMNCGVTSLYWYFRSKEELVDALVDRVSREAFTRLPAVGDGAWDDELLNYFVSFRTLMHRSPLYREIFSHSTRVTYGPSRLGRQVLRRTDAGLSLLTRAGFSPQQAAILHTVFSNYTMGFILREYSAADEGEEDARATNESIERLGASELPELVQVDDFGTIRAFGDEQFVVGLRLLLQGARRELESPEVTTPTKPKRRSRAKR
jgi:AcrR family transcriptional regulator